MTRHRTAGIFWRTTSLPGILDARWDAAERRSNHSSDGTGTSAPRDNTTSEGTPMFQVACERFFPGIVGAPGNVSECLPHASEAAPRLRRMCSRSSGVHVRVR